MEETSDAPVKLLNKSAVSGVAIDSISALKVISSISTSQVMLKILKKKFESSWCFDVQSSLLVSQ